MEQEERSIHIRMAVADDALRIEAVLNEAIID